MNENEANQIIGGEKLNSLLGGFGLGAGATGLYYLAKHLRNKMRTPTTDLSAIANAPMVPALPAPEEEEKIGFDTTKLLMPGAGAGIGALIGAIRGGKGKKLQSALTGAGVGAVGGMGADMLSSPAVRQYIGEHVPRSLPWPAPFGGDGQMSPSSETGGHMAARYAGGLGLAAAGAYGGHKAVQALTEKNKNEGNKNKVQSARDEYFNTLLNDENDDEEEKKSTAAAFDVLYNVYAEKRSAGEPNQATFENYFWPENGERGPWHGPLSSAWNNLSGTVQLGGLAALAAGGGVGAHYMYNKTKSQSQARALARAQAARERMKGLDAPYVDPQELANIKNLASNRGPAHARGI